MPLVELPGFDTAVARRSYRGSRALALCSGPRPCQRCNAGLVVRLDPVTQPALFYHGGYGAAEEVTVDVCLACGRSAVSSVSSRNPRPPRRHRMRFTVEEVPADLEFLNHKPTEVCCNGHEECSYRHQGPCWQHPCTCETTGNCLSCAPETGVR